jgi:HlyD family secretion protein
MTSMIPGIRRLFWPAALSAVAVALVAAAVLFSRTAASSPSPQAGVVGGDGEGVVCFGVVDLEHGVASLYPLQPGRVHEVMVHENQAVSQGTELLRLEDGVARSRLAEAQAAVEAAELQVRQARRLPVEQAGRVAQQQAALDAVSHRLAAARLTLAHRQKQAQSKIASDLEVGVSEEAVRELEALERGEVQRLKDLQGHDVQADVGKAEKELAAARARQEQARLALAEYTLRAPRSGTVLRLLVGPGDVLGGQPAQAAVLFAADGPQVVRAEVEQEFARRIHEGQPATVEDEADATASWPAHVERISGWYNQRRAVLHDPTQLHDVRTVEVLVVLEPGQPRLRLGQSVRVRIGSVAP